MSLPRPVIEGKSYLVTRRATRRYFVFRPDENKGMQRIFLYCLAVVAAEHGVVVHAVVLMSDHVHVVLTDVRGVFPDFVRELHRTLANVTKCHRGWPEEVFNKSQTSRVELLTPGALADKIGYTLANPVACFAVRYPADWPGVTTRVDDMGSGVVIRIERPGPYFDPENTRWPDVAELSFALPDALVQAHGSDDGARAAIRAALDRHVEQAHREARRLGKTFLGARRVMRAPITARGTSYEVLGERNPTFAAAGETESAMRATYERSAFLSGYAEALERWQAGDRDAAFPHGTWWMRVHHHANCAQPP